MARVTVEDCLKVVTNRFELVIVAAKRARQLMRGTVDSKVPWDNDKSTVVALREIASGYKDFTDVPEPEETLVELHLPLSSAEEEGFDESDEATDELLEESEDLEQATDENEKPVKGSDTDEA